MHLQVNAASATARTFRKSPPKFEVADIYAAKDYNGSFVNNLSDVHAFLGGLLNAQACFRRNPHACSPSWDEMEKDTIRSCVLRHIPAEESGSCLVENTTWLLMSKMFHSYGDCHGRSFVNATVN